MYEVTIRGSAGVFYISADRNRVKFEIENLPEGWQINIWDVSDKKKPVLCDLKDFE